MSLRSRLWGVQSPKGRGLFISLAVVLVGIAYANSLEIPFHFDDFHSIQDNPALKDLRNIPRYFTDVSAFSPLAENRAYRPFLLLSFALSFGLSGGAPWGYHLISLLLQVMGAVVVGRLGRRLLLAGGAKAELADAVGLLLLSIFAVHPLLSEAVNYISARSSLQAAVLSFASVHAYVKGREEGKKAWLWISALALLLGMGTKIIAMSVPVLLVGWEVTLGPSRAHLRADGARAWFMRLGPSFVVAVSLTVLHELMLGPGERTSRGLVTPISYFLTQVQVYLRFMGLLFWPEDLCADLTMPWATDPLEWPVARALFVNAALLLAALSVGRRWPLVPFGLCWFYATLAPTNSFAPLSEPATEHRVYIALPGLLFALAGLLAPLLERRPLSAHGRRVAVVAAALLVAALTARTANRNRVWQSDAGLWEDVVKRSPDNGRAHLNYGLALMARGELAAARQSFDRCAQAWPRYTFCYINQAVLAIHEKRFLEARRSMGIAESLAARNVYVLLWRGKLERAEERWAEAAEAFRQTLLVAPGHKEASLGLAVSVFMSGQLEAARPMLEALQEGANLDADGAYALGFLADQRGDRPEAIARYRAALNLDRSHPRARYNLGVALQSSGDLKQAIVEYEVLRRQEPVMPDALYNLAVAYWQDGRARDAEEVRTELKARAPDYPGLGSLTF